VLIENVTHHIEEEEEEEEEQDWFPHVRAGLGRRQLQRARKKAPRSPAQPSALSVLFLVLITGFADRCETALTGYGPVQAAGLPGHCLPRETNHPKGDNSKLIDPPSGAHSYWPWESGNTPGSAG
jgi:hypothetical protein